MENQTEEIKLGSWVMRARLPEGEGPHPVGLLLHGLSGDEKVMWIFASRMPKDLLLLAPRATHPFSGGGYSWVPDRLTRLPGTSDFEEPVEALVELLERLGNGDVEEGSAVGEAIREADFSQVSLVGFSQGAALSYTFALMNPQRSDLIAGLSGFVPEGAERLAEERPLRDKKVFITHGTKDETVPIAKAREAAEVLEKAGADVSFCEEDTGHKLSVACFRSLGAFFSENKTQRSSAR
jgi:phospholipase/carboxylesterase